MSSSSEARRLRAVLGDDEPVAPVEDAAAADWADGYGVVSPDVARYVEVLRGVPDAVVLAMRNVAATQGIELVDPDTATLLALLARSLRPERVLEVGTGLGYLTLHLARAVPGDCTVTSIEADPVRQAQAHAFLERDRFECATELRLGDPMRVLREGSARASWDMVVLPDPALPRMELVDLLAARLAPDGILAIPWALRGGRVADGFRGLDDDFPDIEAQRTLNRYVAIDPRFCDVALLPVGDGLLIARRRD
jgi:predicted O-methyltransferase YrrM